MLISHIYPPSHLTLHISKNCPIFHETFVCGQQIILGFGEVYLSLLCFQAGCQEVAVNSPLQLAHWYWLPSVGKSLKPTVSMNHWETVGNGGSARQRCVHQRTKSLCLVWSTLILSLVISVNQLNCLKLPKNWPHHLFRPTKVEETRMIYNRR